MKKNLGLAASLLVLNLAPAFGQALTPERQVPPIEALGQSAQSPAPPAVQLPPVPLSPTTFAQRLRQLQSNADTPALTKFNLDFPGGTPRDLVAAIEKATAKPLNVIIPDEDADTKLPPLRMHEVDVARLFQALEYVSERQVTMAFGSSYSSYSLSYWFRTTGQPTDNSVWYFHVEKPSSPLMKATQPTCKFYSLATYLDRGLTVDDITTAIQTGWKMAGVTPTPELNYHKETKLLIAYGDPYRLATIDDVLRTLPASNVTLAAARDYENGWSETRNQMAHLETKVKELEEKLARIAATTTNAAAAENPGK